MRRLGGAIGRAAAAAFTAGFLVLWPLAAPRAEAAPRLNGHVEYETFGYTDAKTADSRWENFFAGTVRGSGEISSTLTWQLEGRAVADDASFTAGGFSMRNGTRRRPYLSLITAVMDYRPLPEVRISAGKQIVNWSIFDELQPANVATPRDESDIFRRVEEGVYGLSIHYGTGQAYADLLVVPLAFRPSRLPQGRWNIITGDAVERQDLPPVRLDETQAAARVGGRMGALEASVTAYVGRDTAAVFVPGELIFLGFVNGVPTFKAQIIDTYSRLRTIGFAASYPVGERTLLRLESVYFDSPNRNHDDFMHTAAGVEYALDDWRFLANYLRDDRMSAAPEEVTNKGERRFFQSFFFGEARYDPLRRLRAQLRGGYDVQGRFFLLQPEISYRLWRALRVSLLGEVIDASQRSYADNKTAYFDTIKHEDRVATRIEYDF